MSTLVLLLTMILILLPAMPTNAQNELSVSLTIDPTPIMQDGAQCWQMSYTGTGQNSIDTTVEALGFTFENDIYTHYSIYRAHATNTGNHLSSANLFNPDKYSDYDAFTRTNLWANKPQYLAGVFQHSGADQMLEPQTQTNTYNRAPIYDCPPPNATGYRYVAYVQTFGNSLNTNRNNNTSTIRLVTKTSTIHKLPMPPSAKQTSDDALFIYYTYQFTDILQNNSNLRDALLRPLLPARYTNDDIIATMNQVLRDKSNDGCGIYSCNDKPEDLE